MYLVNEINDWKDSLPSILIALELSDIYNDDETGLYFIALPHRSQTLQNKSVKVEKWLKKD